MKIVIETDEVVEKKPTGPTLCINMIVKNESKIITRMLDTVLPIIDAYCICDTGSTDNTVQMIEDYFKEKNIPGKVVVEPFINFSHNRNFALKACEGLSDYVLLMDADMKLKIINFDKNRLKQLRFVLHSARFGQFFLPEYANRQERRAFQLYWSHSRVCQYAIRQQVAVNQET
jgi:glycosyltransferase involved in cell wall biosynthesis